MTQKSKESSWEKTARLILKKLKVKYKQEVRIWFERKFRCDFVVFFWNRKIWIEVDGSQHNKFLSIIYDIKRDRHILTRWINHIYRINYKELKKWKLQKIIKYEKTLYKFKRIIKIIVVMSIIAYILYKILLLSDYSLTTLLHYSTIFK